MLFTKTKAKKSVDRQQGGFTPPVGHHKKTDRQIPSSQQAGFTVVEIAVGLVVIGLIVVSITNIFITIGVIQRQNAKLSLASRIAEQKIESLRNNHYNTLALSPPPVDFTNELPDSLPEPRSATVTVSEPEPGLKRLDVTITYREANRAKTIQMSALIGNIGISQ